MLDRYRERGKRHCYFGPLSRARPKGIAMPDRSVKRGQKGLPVGALYRTRPKGIAMPGRPQTAKGIVVPDRFLYRDRKALLCRASLQTVVKKRCYARPPSRV